MELNSQQGAGTYLRVLVPTRGLDGPGQVASGSLWWGWGLVCSWYLGVVSPAAPHQAPWLWQLGDRRAALLGLGSPGAGRCQLLAQQLGGGAGREGSGMVENGRVWAFGMIQHPVAQLLPTVTGKGFPSPPFGSATCSGSWPPPALRC